MTTQGAAETRIHPVVLTALALVLLLIAACAPAAKPTGAGAAGRPIKIGFVSPETGTLAPFGEADAFVLHPMKKQFANGITIAGVTHPVEIIVKDTQSDPNRASEVAEDLILKDDVDLILVASNAETTNPVSDQCELNAVPCISTAAPWQAWFIGRGGLPGTTDFKYTYHFFAGLEDISAVYSDLWAQVPTDKVVGGLWPNDGDGTVGSNPEVGFPPVLTKNGYTIVDPGRYQSLKADFSAEIGQFKTKNAEIVTGVVIPPNLGTIMMQMSQQGFYPKMVTMGKAALFPSAVELIPNGLGEGLTTEIWWTPHHPFKSSLTGQSAKELAAAFEAETNKQWTQPIGFTHALFEVAADVLERTQDIDEPQSIVNAIKATNLDTVVGKVQWGTGPVPNVAKTPLVGGQWVKGTKYPFDLVITSNTLAPNIPTGGTTQTMPWAK